MKEGSVVVGCEDYGVAHLGVHGKRIMEVTAKEHVDVLITAQKHVDSAVSKTCNVPEDYSYEDFKDLYMRAYEGGAKGCTTYRPNGNYPDVIKSADVPDVEPEEESCGFDPETGQRTGPCAD
jgi:ribonucleoside-diphosphate reductase alpha chain